MILKPQDIVILLKLIVWHKGGWSYAMLSKELFMSVSEVHKGIKRSVEARLFNPENKTIFKNAFEEYLIHGVKYAYPPHRGGQTRGIPTGYAAPPLNTMISQPLDNPPVWPYPEGKILGYEFSPLFRSVPKAISIDNNLYELLTLVDAIRDGRAREREIAINELKSRIKAK
jgi:hypothetical protein